MTSWRNKAVKWLRIIHRDLGYLMVGVCMVYGLSGMLLNHMDGKDPAYKTTTATLHLPTGLDREGLAAAWSAEGSLPPLKTTAPVDDEHIRLMLRGGIGVYSSATGTLDYELHSKRPLVYWINKLHYNKVGGWSFMADFFAGSLLFFAISGLFLVRGKKGIAGRGKWYLLLGLIIPLCYVLFS